ncbi:26S proteasome non-ATPase regulatory subunit 12 homolog B-like [Hibiscus syriacus]|uniref:26S proteasome non-ATPase regulatory subunit 12 homolog B-like n=1 Tax=Hibiscus syriacus TaxID=106335 RepID=UPI001920EB38|nr:26S proteasome non-ATPase regulatory subunit 12 homolog B-like [Hibiscus syriacus]
MRDIGHKMLVVSKWYSKITIKRLAELMSLTIHEAKKYLSKIVVSKAMVAQIDQPIRLVSFQRNNNSNEHLDSWVLNVDNLVHLLEKSFLLGLYKNDFENEKNLQRGSFGDQATEDLRMRDVGHKMLVVSKWYSKIILKRLDELFCLTIQEAMKQLSEIVVSKVVVAKIDQPMRLVSF